MLSAGVLGLVPITAWATTCVYQGSVRPGPDDENVPTNTRIWIHDIATGAVWKNGFDEECPPPRLLGSDGSEPGFTMSVIPEDADLPLVLVLTPQEPLTVGTGYLVDFECFGVEAGSQPHTFTVSQPADEVAPSIPSLVEYDVEHSSSHVGTEAHYASLLVETDGPFVLLDREGDSTFDPIDLSGTLTDVFDVDHRQPTVGDGFCSIANWPDADRGDETTIRLATMDLAGNMSKWSESETIVLGCGCRSSGGGGFWGWLLVPLLWRRRRPPGAVAH